MTNGELVSRVNSRRGSGGVRVPELAACILGSADVANEEGPVVTSGASHMPSAPQQLRSSRPRSNDLKEPPIRLRRWAAGLDGRHWPPTSSAVVLRPPFAGFGCAFFRFCRLVGRSQSYIRMSLTKEQRAKALGVK